MKKQQFELTIIDKKNIPTEEPARQYYFMDIAKEYVTQLAAKKGAPLTFHVTTFGCPMVIVTQKCGNPLFI